MQDFITSSFTIGSLVFPNRLVQGPLAGFSCAPFRELFHQFKPPAYAVTEMISAHDIVHKHSIDSRYLKRSNQEKILCYQIAGTDPQTMAEASLRLENLGADLIDINCGCPKTKIRKKGAGSALLQNQGLLNEIVAAIRKVIRVPLTVKLRIQKTDSDLALAKAVEEAGADALIVHGRHWTEDYETPNNYSQIARIKAEVSIPVIANGDIASAQSLAEAYRLTDCDAYMIARAGTGKPWLYQDLLDGKETKRSLDMKKELFMTHLQGLANLEGDYKALMQSKSLLRYYFRQEVSEEHLRAFYKLERFADLEPLLKFCLSREGGKGRFLT